MLPKCECDRPITLCDNLNCSKATFTNNATMTQSNEPTIEQMNEVICTFMSGHRMIGGTIHVYKGPDEIEWETGKYLKYHASWDWLMPVGKNIRDMLQDMLKKRPPHTACHGDLIEVDIYCAISEYDIVKSHKYIYDFITWLNQQSK